MAVEMDEGGSSDGFQEGRFCQVRAGEESSAEVVGEGHGWGGWEGGVGVGEGLDGERIGRNGVGGHGGCGKGADVENGEALCVDDRVALDEWLFIIIIIIDGDCV